MSLVAGLHRLTATRCCPSSKYLFFISDKSMRLDRNITHEVYGVYLTFDGSVALDGWSITRECTATVYKHPKILNSSEYPEY